MNVSRGPIHGLLKILTINHAYGEMFMSPAGTKLPARVKEVSLPPYVRT